MESAGKQMDLSAFVKEHDDSCLIKMLYAIQGHFNYLPEAVLRELAVLLNKPLIELYRIVTFYKVFSLEPRGRHKVTVCTGTACHVRGSEEIVEEASRCLCVERGKTSADGEYTLETVNCLGACALGPLVEIDGEYHGNLNKMDLRKLLEKMKEAAVAG